MSDLIRKDIDELDSAFVEVVGRSTLIELKLKSILEREEKGITNNKKFSKITSLFFEKFESHLSKEDKEIISEACEIRHKLVHYDLNSLKELFPTVNSPVCEISLADGSSKPVDQNSSFFSLYLDFLFSKKEKIIEPIEKARSIIINIAKKTTHAK